MRRKGPPLTLKQMQTDIWIGVAEVPGERLAVLTRLSKLLANSGAQRRPVCISGIPKPQRIVCFFQVYRATQLYFNLVSDRCVCALCY